jgi:arsenate reductase
MAKYHIYHNPRCSKSREALKELEAMEVEFEVIQYLNEPITFEQMTDLLEKLDISAEELVRKNESVWKESFADKELDEEEIIFAMIEFPKLIQRPIVVKGEKAVIARPKEEIKKLL